MIPVTGSMGGGCGGWYRRRRTYSRDCGGRRYLRRRRGSGLFTACGEPSPFGTGSPPWRAAGRAQRAAPPPDRRGQALLRALLRALPKHPRHPARRRSRGFVSRRHNPRSSKGRGADGTWAGARLHPCWPNSPRSIRCWRCIWCLPTPASRSGRTVSTSHSGSTGLTIQPSSRARCVLPAHHLRRTVVPGGAWHAGETSGSCEPRMPAPRAPSPPARSLAVPRGDRLRGGQGRRSSFQRQWRRAPRLGARRQGALGGRSVRRWPTTSKPDASSSASPTTGATALSCSPPSRLAIRCRRAFGSSSISWWRHI
jgi:hypothetical protein